MKDKSNVLLPVGGQDSLGLVVPGQPVDPALDENQTELGVLILHENRAQRLGLRFQALHYLDGLARLLPPFCSSPSAS